MLAGVARGHIQAQLQPLQPKRVAVVFVLNLICPHHYCGVFGLDLRRCTHGRPDVDHKLGSSLHRTGGLVGLDGA